MISIQGDVAILPEVSDKIEERIRLWSKSERPVEWACCLIGNIAAKGDEAFLVIKDFLELPAYNLNREHGIAVCLNDIKRIAEKYFIVGILHSHPSEDLMPSANDIAMAIYVDILLSRPILHIIASPNGEKLILSFDKCHECQNSFFNIITSKRSISRRGL